MPIKFTHLLYSALVAGGLLCVAAMPAQAEKPKQTQQVTDYQSCESNGGSMKACCAKVGGTYTSSTTTTPKGITVETEMCAFARSAGVRPAVKLSHVIGPEGRMQLN